MVFPAKYKENMSSLYFPSILEFLMQIEYPDSGIYEVIIITLGGQTCMPVFRVMKITGRKHSVNSHI